jgi:BirA family biotin operon repressor/biotin-[acetyl-CoA-carboxylase] ligase
MSSEHGGAWTDAARLDGRIGRRIEAHLRLGSTNDRAREALAAGQVGVVVLAEEQTAGRGRHGRTWLSPPGRNLTLSVPLRPRLAAERAGLLSLSMALAARDACATVAPCRLKWPNDVESSDGRKLGGILIETVIAGERLDAAIVGVGLNVNWRRAEMPAGLRERATSLAEEVGHQVDRVGVLRALLDAMELRLEELEAGSSPVDDYRAACAMLAAEVVVETGPGELVEGRALDIDERGALVVQTGAGTVSLPSGEVVRVGRAVTA